jgi:hypothetical protein
MILLEYNYREAIIAIIMRIITIPVSIYVMIGQIGLIA